MTHRTGIKWRNERVVMDRAKFKGWKIEEDQTSAYGPCPACGGEAWGPPIYEAAKGEDADVAPLESIPCRCHCGSEHGEDGAVGCGRHWVVPGDGKFEQ